MRYRVIPYIQLHEFEGLLFNDMDIFIQHLRDKIVDGFELRQTIEDYPNPELINDTPDNAPSHRLERCIKGYNKVIDGSILAHSIGLARIRAKSPRFHQWITALETL